MRRGHWRRRSHSPRTAIPAIGLILILMLGAAVPSRGLCRGMNLSRLRRRPARGFLHLTRAWERKWVQPPRPAVEGEDRRALSHPVKAAGWSLPWPAAIIWFADARVRARLILSRAGATDSALLNTFC
jgi:hypothetical protein